MKTTDPTYDEALSALQAERDAEANRRNAASIKAKNKLEKERYEQRHNYLAVYTEATSSIPLKLQGSRARIAAVMGEAAAIEAQIAIAQQLDEMPAPLELERLHGRIAALRNEAAGKLESLPKLRADMKALFKKTLPDLYQKLVETGAATETTPRPPSVEVLERFYSK